MYEAGALLSLQLADETLFERHVTQARTYYVDYAGLLPPSPRQNLVLGLNLMRLMAQNRIGEFHTELELIPVPARSDPHIEYVLRLEHCLMEGSYSKLRAERGAMPDPCFVVFVERLMETVRKEMADCCEKAYECLPVAAAVKMLWLGDSDELAAFVIGRGWRVEGDVVTFEQRDRSAVEQVPAREIIERSLGYARELEQII